jgi:hypothetical protein
VDYDEGRDPSGSARAVTHAASTSVGLEGITVAQAPFDGRGIDVTSRLPLVTGMGFSTTTTFRRRRSGPDSNATLSADLCSLILRADPPERSLLLILFDRVPPDEERRSPFR